MPIPILPLLITAAKWLGRIGIAAFAINEVKKLTSGQKASIDEGTKQAQAAGISDTEYRKLVAATTFDQVEQDGKNPDDFWSDLSPEGKEALQFSPETLRQDMARTKFLGLSAALLFIGALAAGGVAGVRGIPILLSTLAKIAQARTAGASALSMLTILEEGKIAGIAAVWIPGLIAGIAGAAGWLTSTMANNLNDAFLWGRIFLGQAAGDFEDAKKERDKLLLIKAGGAVTTPGIRTIIRMVEEKKPEQFIGTLFSAKLGPHESFNRVIDDEITDEADLINDVKINLNKWLLSLPGRLGYSVIIRKDPVDEFGVKQSGTWATLTTHFTRLSGPIQPIDTILLGPVTPATKLKLSKVIRTIETQIPKMLTAQEVRQIEIPSGAVDIFDTSGERVDLGVVPVVAPPVTPTPPQAEVPPVAISPTPEIPIPTAPLSTLERVTAGLPVPPVSPPTVPVPTPVSTLPAEVTAVQWGSTPEEDSGGTVCAQTCGRILLGVAFKQHQILRVNTKGSRLNLRASPGLAGVIIDKLVDGVLVRVNNSRGEKDGFMWLDISIPIQPQRTTSKAGIVAASFLETL